MKTIKDIQSLEGVTVLMRVDFNVPLLNGKVRDNYRIQSILPTVRFLQGKGAKLVLISHIESDEGTLAPVVPEFEKLLNEEGVGSNSVGQGRSSPKIEKVKFIENYRNAKAEIDALPAGGIVLLENLRKYPGEKANDKTFSKELASLADIYVNEAFSVSHREHASVVGVTKFLPSYAGLQFEEEVRQISVAFNPPRPFFFLLGGAKFETKLPLVTKYLAQADKVFIGGALANDCFKVMGYNVGASKVSEGADVSAIIKSSKLVLPVDVIALRGSTAGASGENVTIDPKEVKDGDIMLDVGPKTVELLASLTKDMKCVVWNGPFGGYEMGYVDSTRGYASVLAKATANGVVSIVGGGDTVAALMQVPEGIKGFTFASTGGGAMLDLLANETLPGILALDENKGE